ncbi:transmembrane amino acid transporter protein-domain-containing protein, partial [Hyaloraphidium curvatum]
MASQRGEVRVVVSAVPAASNDSLDEEVSVYDEADAPDETAALLPGKAKPAASGIVGTCSFPQTTFNVVNLIVGLGLLSIPYCLRQAGWAFGLPALALCVLVMNRTARMVCRCLADGGHAFVPTSFPDLADAAFGGTAARALISILFVTELYVADVAILIVAADNLSQLYPGVPALHAKLLVGAVMYASTFLNLAYLSYTSLFGMLGSLTLVSAVVFDGLTKSESPGSLLDPMPTELWTTPYRLTLVVGILISCLSGHAVYPGIYLAMRGRERVGRVLDLSFGIVAAVYATMAVTGYLMFGEDTSNEITKNLL